jgi:hypothetical protein
MLRSSKQLSYEQILELGSIDQLTRFMANKEINQEGYQSVANQWKAFEKRFGVRIEESGVSIEKLADMIAQRNLLAHNNGIVNDRYFEAVITPSLARGQRVQLDEDRFNEYADALFAIVKHTVASLKTKHCGPAEPNSPGTTTVTDS